MLMSRCRNQAVPYRQLNTLTVIQNGCCYRQDTLVKDGLYGFQPLVQFFVAVRLAVSDSFFYFGQGNR